MATRRDFTISYGLQADKSGAGTNTLVVDSTNDRVGIATGATTPVATLDVRGAATATQVTLANRPLSTAYNCWSETGSGAMGIIGHNARAGTTINTVVANNSSWHGHFIRMYYNHGIAVHTTTGFVNAGDVLYDNTTPANQVASSGERLRILPNGNVGLNSTAPNYLLDVNGDARITSTNRLRFGGSSAASNYFIQYNSTANSLDFVAG